MILCLSLYASQSIAASSEEIFKQTSPQVMPLDVLNEKGEVMATQSAVVTDAQTVVAQCDSLSGAKAIRLRNGDVNISASVLRRDVMRNLCLLNAAELQASPARFADFSSVKAGMRVYAISNTLGFGIGITEGVVSALREIRGETFVQYTASIGPGSEGGGLFDEQGRLVGIIRYRKMDGQNVNFAVPVRWVEEIPLRTKDQVELRTWSENAQQIEQKADWPALAKFARDRLANKRDDGDAWHFLARAEEQQKNWKAVAEAYREIIKQNPEDLSSQFSLATALLELKDYVAVIDLLRPMLAQHREDGRIWGVMAYAERLLGHQRTAMEYFEEAGRLQSWNKNIQYAIAETAQEQGDEARALRAIRQVVHIDSTDVRGWLSLTDVYLRMGRSAKALQAVEHALDIDATSGVSLSFKARVLSAFGRHREAIDLYKAVIEKHPPNEAWVWSWLGLTYYEIKRYPEAIEAYRKAVALNPDNEYFTNSLVITLKDGSHYQDALSLLEREKSKRMADPFVWRQFGFVYASLADDAKSIPAFEKSLKLDPSQTKVWAALAEAYHRANRPDDVKRVHQRLVQLNREWAEYIYKTLLLPYEVQQ